MDDWDQLADLGDCGALLETYIPGVSIRWITEGEYIIPARVARRYLASLLARINAAVRMHANGWPIDAIHDTILIPCKAIRAQLHRAEVDSQGFMRDHIVRSKLT